MRTIQTLLIFTAGLSLLGCNAETTDSSQQTSTQSIQVTATAYTSTKGQTDKTPYLAAWNNILKPGVKSIAVSRDLIPMGLTNGVKVTIEGLKGEYLVLDKMNKRWERKIDIYMGHNHEAAKDWGKQTVTIHWPKTSAQ